MDPRELAKMVLEDLDKLMKRYGEDMARSGGGAYWALEYLEKAKHELIMDMIYG
jgi:hypothetical protein